MLLLLLIYNANEACFTFIVVVVVCLYTQETTEKTKECNPRCYGDIRHWTHGCYTLVHDTRAEGVEYALDAMLTFGGEGEKRQTSEDVIWGFIVYSAKITHRPTKSCAFHARFVKHKKLE